MITLTNMISSNVNFLSHIKLSQVLTWFKVKSQFLSQLKPVTSSGKNFPFYFHQLGVGEVGHKSDKSIRTSYMTITVISRCHFSRPCRWFKAYFLVLVFLWVLRSFLCLVAPISTLATPAVFILESVACNPTAGSVPSDISFILLPLGSSY